MDIDVDHLQIYILSNTVFEKTTDIDVSKCHFFPDGEKTVFFFTWQAWNFLVYFSQDENISIFFKRCSILKKICIHEISATLLPLF